MNKVREKVLAVWVCAILAVSPLAMLCVVAGPGTVASRAADDAPSQRALGGLWNPNGPRESATTHIISPGTILSDIPGPRPSAVDNSAGLPPVGNQFTQGSCTAWAIGYYHASYIENRESPIDLTQPENQTSPSFLYHLANGGYDGGSYMEDVADLLISNGACSMAEMEYSPTDLTDWPTDDWKWVSGMKRKAVSQNWLNLAEPGGMDALKAYLADGNTATTGISVWSNFDNIENFNYTYSSSERYGSDRGGHIVTICGYDDDKATADGLGAFRMVNSWGTGWGEAGYWWMTYEALVDGYLGYGWVMYLESELNYEPKAVIKVQIDHPERGDIIRNYGLSLTVYESGVPIYGKSFLGCYWIEDWYGTAAQNHPFPAGKMAFDISEIVPYMNASLEHQFVLSMANSDSQEGALMAFDVLNGELWEGGFSIEVPVNITANTAAQANVWVYPGIFLHQQIRIDGDVDMARTAIGELWVGNGTEANPYQIHDYYIGGGGQGNCIFVGNTSGHFEIRGCYVEEASSAVGWDYYMDSGILLHSAANGVLDGNSATANLFGIVVMQSNGIVMTANNADGNSFGILVSNSSDVAALENHIANNTDYGMLVELSTGIAAYHNSFVGNAINAGDYDSANAWDDGYPSGGNYWGDYGGADIYSGPGQNITGSDGIGDEPYAGIESLSGSLDNYPLMTPWPNAIVTSGIVRNLNTGENFTAIQAAIDDPDTLGGHIILAGNGTYRENVLVNKSIALTGSGGTVVDGGGFGGITVLANGTSVENLAVTNGTLAPGAAGIKLVASGCAVRKTEVSNCSTGISIGDATAPISATIDTTADFDSGTKSSSLDSFEVETVSDNPTVSPGEIRLASLYGDAFNTPDSDGATWKWQNGNGKIFGTGVYSTQTKNFDVTRTNAGYMALDYVTATDDLGIMGPSQINSSSNWDVQIDFNSIYAENNNQWLFGIYLYKDWNGSGVAPGSNAIRFIYYGYDVERRYYVDLFVGGVSQGGNFVTTAHTSGKMRATYNATTTTLRFYYWGGTDWTTLWTKTYNMNAWKLKLLVPLASYSTSLPDIRMEFDNYRISGSFATPPYRTSGNWTSAVQPMPAEQRLLSTALSCGSLTATEYIDRVEWLVQGAVVAAYENDVHASGNVTIANADLTYGSFVSVDQPYQIRIFMAGNGWRSPSVLAVSSAAISSIPSVQGNVVENNVIQNNGVGVAIIGASASAVFHNSFLGNAVHALDGGLNGWDDGYPSGGNYWDDYNGTDAFSGPGQNVTGGDGIGDDPYTLIGGSAGAWDHYPLMAPWVPPLPDTAPPWHADETPGINGIAPNATPVISVRVTDESVVSAPSIRLYVDGFSIFFDLQPVAGGYVVSYWHEMGFPFETSVTCRIVAADTLGNVLDFTWQFTTPTPYRIPVQLGWNLISIPVIQASSTLPGSLQDLEGDTLWDRAMWYDPRDAGDHWKQYNANWPPAMNDLVGISPSMGVWVQVTVLGDGFMTIWGERPTVTYVQLRAGWNLVGYPSLNATMTVAEVFWGTSVSVVEVFDPAQPYLTRVVGPAYLMSPCKGYWVYSVADSVWTVDW
jgi:parallel beta-helix repeat protein